MQSIKEQKAEGKAIRKEQIAREQHGIWEVKKDREEVIRLIKGQEKTRSKHLLPLRHERMMVSPFTFYRGSAILQAVDLASMPYTPLTVQACGDAHISNFGIFGTPERRLVFDINDFDETFPGPFEVDMKRLCASIEICGRDRGFSKKERRAAVEEAALAYRKCMNAFSEMGNLEVWYSRLDLEDLVEKNPVFENKAQKENMKKVLDKARSKNNDMALRKLTETVDGRIRIKSNPPLIVPIREMSKDERKNFNFDTDVRMALELYAKTLPVDRQGLLKQYEPIELAHKVVGVGSVGTKAWILVMLGRENGDPLVLQIKEAMPSVLEGKFGQKPFRQNGRRVAVGQKLIQTVGDIFLGWFCVSSEDGKKGDYYVRQLWNQKGSFVLEDLSPDGLKGLSAMCAWNLAHAHAKTGNRHMIAGYLGKNEAFDQAMVKYAALYADQSEADYETFCRWVKKNDK